METTYRVKRRRVKSIRLLTVKYFIFECQPAKNSSKTLHRWEVSAKEINICFLCYLWWIEIFCFVRHAQNVGVLKNLLGINLKNLAMILNVRAIQSIFLMSREMLRYLKGSQFSFLKNAEQMVLKFTNYIERRNFSYRENLRDNNSHSLKEIGISKVYFRRVGNILKHWSNKSRKYTNRDSSVIIGPKLTYIESTWMALSRMCKYVINLLSINTISYNFSLTLSSNSLNHNVL